MAYQLKPPLQLITLPQRLRLSHCTNPYDMSWTNGEHNLCLTCRRGTQVVQSSYHCPQIRTSLLMPGHLMTPLFSTARFPPYLLYGFFFPSVPPVTVVKTIITILDEQHSRTVLLPFIANFAPFVKILPSFLRDLTQWVRCVAQGYCPRDSDRLPQIAGADFVMRDFVKVTGRRPEEGPVPETSSLDHLKYR
jgi:hypothetical protein